MFRFFYFVLYLLLQYALRIYFKTTQSVNPPKEFFGRTIYVSNHAAAFMDPLVTTALRRPIVFFMTRSDVFNRFTRPFLWASHMLPIYRQHDGEDTKSRNFEVFDTCSRILSWGRNLMIFGEGFTDDVFIRRLKPVKKGAARIGFYALEKQNWKKKIYVAAVGCNYTNPNELRSEILVSTSNKICLNDYKEEYLKNPNKVINEVTKLIEGMMQSQITHVRKSELSPLHEAIQSITEKGMNSKHSDFSIPLERRFEYSRELAEAINANEEDILTIKDEWLEKTKDYFAFLEEQNLTSRDVREFEQKGKLSNGTYWMQLILLFPFVLLSLIHCYLPYRLTKNFVEKSFRRKVFWGSVKLLIGMISMGLINLPVIWLFEAYIYPNYLLAVLYFLCIGLFFMAFVQWKQVFVLLNRRKKISVDKVENAVAWKQKLIAEIKDVLPKT